MIRAIKRWYAEHRLAVEFGYCRKHKRFPDAAWIGAKCRGCHEEVIRAIDFQRATKDARRAKLIKDTQ